MANLKKDSNEVELIEHELFKMEMELNEYYCEAGKIIMEKAGQHERKINNLVDTIIETRKQLAEAQNKKYCPNCDEQNDQSNNFCKRCGHKLTLNNESEGV